MDGNEGDRPHCKTLAAYCAILAAIPCALSLKFATDLQACNVKICCISVLPELIGDWSDHIQETMRNRYASITGTCI